MIRVAVGLLLCGWLAACENAREPAGGGQGEADGVVARAGDVAFTLADVEATVQLSLYDLEIQQFRLLRNAAEATLIARLDASGGGIAELTLTPPLPPRLAVAADPLRVRPPRPASAAQTEPAARQVTLLTFCNFESPHCARLQIRLDGLLQLYPGVLELAVRDFELPFHRSAGFAAEASRCALEQDAYWPFHDALHAGTGALDRSRLERAAATAGVPAAEFSACLDSGRWADAVRADTALAAGLGLSLVPVVFVNGLYAGPDPGADQLIGLIEHELSRLGVNSPRRTVAERPSQAPIVLHALIHSSAPGQGLVLAGSGGGAIGVLREGDALTPSLLLRRVTASGIELLNAGVPEVLPYDASGPGAPLTGSGPGTGSGSDASLITTPHIAVPVTLDRGEVLVRLADRGGLEGALVPVAMRAGDYRLVRITAIAPGSLYELLGFESGDVILGVNEQPAHEADMPLWRALESDAEVRVRVMRAGGVAQHYTFRFDD